MCLSIVTKQIENPSGTERYAYKGFHIGKKMGRYGWQVDKDGNPRTQLEFPYQVGVVKRGVWLTAKGKWINIGGWWECYPAGFHCYRTKKEALFANFSHMTDSLIIVRVKIRFVCALGFEYKQDLNDLRVKVPVLVAKELFVPEEKKKNAAAAVPPVPSLVR